MNVKTFLTIFCLLSLVSCATTKDTEKEREHHINPYVVHPGLYR